MAMRFFNFLITTVLLFPDHTCKYDYSNTKDEMIASRRKETITASRRGGRDRVSTVDRAIGAGRAKRNAAVNARRQMNPAAPAVKKPTQMEIEKEVKTQADRSQRAKVRQVQNKAGGRVAAAGGRKERAAKKPATQQVKTKTAAVQFAPSSTAKPPTRKAVNAAVQAFKANGFDIPPGTHMVIRFEEANKPASNNTAGRGGAGRARGAGRGGGRGNNNKVNSNSNSNTGNNGGRSNNTNNRRGGRGGRGRGRN
jgi:hypothetical protein